ncbi:MAG: hydrogenase maturation nickel metallochaperone HypA [Thermoanaerobaculum sp.]
MHETSIALEILKTSESILTQHGGSRIVRVKVAVGELSAVEPELLHYAWEAVTVGGPAEGSRLEVDFLPAKQICPTCGPVPRSPGAWLPLCLACGAPLLVEGGHELDLVQVEFEVDGGTP